jgi:signal peptidase II
MILIIISGLILALDQLSKLYIQRNMALRQPIDVIGDIFRITYVRNTGAAFSILADRTYILIAISIVAAALIIFFYRRLPKNERWMRVAMSFILGGALGNLIDRLSYGAVIDFLDFGWKSYRFATFNFADSFIDAGVIMIVVKVLFFGRRGQAGADGS